MNHLKNIYKKFEDILFVNYSCISCEREIFDNKNFSLCEDCFKKLDIINMPKCKKCGDSMGQNLYCEACYNKSYSFDRNISLCYYTDISSNIIKRFKYSNKRYLAEYIVNLMVENLEIPKDTDYVTYVPSSKAGKKERGYNQTEDMAKLFSEKTGIPLLEILGKNEGFSNQASLDKKGREENLKNAFYTILDDKNIIKNKNILLIDDVFTTGTTLSRCADTLKRLKPKSIITMTFAKTNMILK